MNHTPGPCQAGPSHDACTYIYDSHGTKVAVAKYPVGKNHAADAKLIAAAPDMRAALENLLLLADSLERNLPHLVEALRSKGLPDSWLQGWQAKFNRARKALAKTEQST